MVLLMEKINALYYQEMKNNGCPEPKLAGDILEVAGISFQKTVQNLI